MITVSYKGLSSALRTSASFKRSLAFFSCPFFGCSLALKHNLTRIRSGKAASGTSQPA